MDTDVILNSDIAELWNHFYRFGDKQVTTSHICPLLFRVPDQISSRFTKCELYGPPLSYLKQSFSCYDSRSASLLQAASGRRLR